jgi:hypothetical protein
MTSSLANLEAASSASILDLLKASSFIAVSASIFEILKAYYLANLSAVSSASILDLLRASSLATL